MAPVPPSSTSRSAPTLRGFMLSSPTLFWAVVGMLSLSLVVLLGWLSFKVFRYLRRPRDDCVLPLHSAKDAPRPLLLPGMLSPGHRPSRPRWFLHGLDGSLIRDTRALFAGAKPTPAWLSRPRTPSAPPAADVEAQRLSPKSKLWVEDERMWAAEVERIRKDMREPIPWVLYVPTEPICPVLPQDDNKDEKADCATSLFAPVPIALPERALVKGAPPLAPVSTSAAVTTHKDAPGLPHSPSTLALASPRVSDAPALDTIAEEEDDEDGPALRSCFSEDSLYSQDSADRPFSALAALAALALPSAPTSPASPEPAPAGDVVPAIVISPCVSLPLPGASTLDEGLAALSAALGGAFLRVPGDDDDDDDGAAPRIPPASRPVLGTVTRNASRRRG
ncbi:uncharacterized protein PHACADRAFT_266088, partial [Phanerochaete carnosa HHB-10118-sp]